MIFTLLLLTALATGPDPATCPMHAEHMKQAQSNADTSHGHGEEVDARHDTFGFSHETSVHHFHLRRNGGAIDLTSNERGEQAVDAIRAHLRDVLADFKSGEFKNPRFVHDKTPDGIDVMQQEKKSISYRFEQLKDGGRIVIETKNPRALKAVHDFMRFQIAEHRTGDPTTVE